MGAAFGFDPREEDEESFRRLLDPQRAQVALEDGQMVGTLGCFPRSLTVPGGEVAMAGTTTVAVLPSHRRRGVLRRLIAAHFEDARNRGEPVAALWASESSIYGRFGYGCAAQELELEIPRNWVGLHRLAPDPEPTRLLSADEARGVVPRVYERVRERRPGFLNRPEEWWDERHFRDPPNRRDGATAWRWAVAGNPASGYARYRVRSKWEGGHGAGTVEVAELVAATPAAEAGLWGLVLNHDLVSSITVWHRPLDDPLLQLLEVPRRAGARLSDALWVRLLDVAAALEARGYAADGVLTLEVVEPGGGKSERVRLEVSGGTASVQPVSTEPEITLDHEDLAAVYLGQPGFRRLARAGRLRGDPVALERADRMFSWDPAPWCPEVF
jgi:predicted acetyltransferase